MHTLNILILIDIVNVEHAAFRQENMTLLEIFTLLAFLNDVESLFGGVYNRV